MLDCPVCPRKNIQESACPQCGADLLPLLRLKELPGTYYNSGIALLQAGRLDEAIQELLVAASFSADSPEPYIALGEAYRQKAMYDASIAQFEKALSLAPTNVELQKAKQAAEEAKFTSSRTPVETTVVGRRNPQFLFGGFALVFLAGLVIVPLVQLFKKVPSPIVTDSFARRDDEIKKALQKLFPELDVQVEQTEQGLKISGEVPTELHRQLITRMVASSVKDKTDLTNLKVKSGEPPSPDLVYQIQPGDNLAKIAKRKYGSVALWKTILEHNREKIKDEARISIGETINLPKITISPQ